MIHVFCIYRRCELVGDMVSGAEPGGGDMLHSDLLREKMKSIRFLPRSGSTSLTNALRPWPWIPGSALVAMVRFPK